MIVRHDMVQCFVARPTPAGAFEILQVRRAADDYMGGTWQTVSGRAETGETAWAAALRELSEETGLVPVEFFRLDKVGSFYVDSTDTLWFCPIFCAIVAANAQVKLNSEHDAFRWLDAAAAAGEFLWPSDRDSLRQVVAEILQNGPARPFMRMKVV